MEYTMKRGVLLKKRGKYVMVLAAAIFAAGSFFAGNYYSKKSDDPQINAPKKVPTKVVGVEALFLDSTYVYLAKDINEQKVTDASSEIRGDSESEKLYEQANQKWLALSSLNQLFETEPLVGDEVMNAKIKKDVESSVVDQTKQLINGLPEDSFSETLRSLVAKAEQEMTPSGEGFDLTRTPEISQANTLVRYVVQDGVVLDGFTLEGYQNAKAAVNALPQSQERTFLGEELKLVETTMTNMGIFYE